MLYLLCYHCHCRYIKIAGLHPEKVGPAITQDTSTVTYLSIRPMYNAMITILVKDCNHISQNIYDSFIHALQLHQLTCSCGHSSCLTIHGYYRRHIRDEHSSSILRILRVRCSECGATHAILLSSIVPYSQISFSVQVNIAEKYDSHLDTVSVCESNPDIDENNIKSMIRSYRRRWRENSARSLSALPLPYFWYGSVSRFFRCSSCRYGAP